MVSRPNLAHVLDLLPAECVTVRASVAFSGQRRLEADNYLSPGFIWRKGIESLPHKPLHQLANIWQPSRLKGIQVGERDGIPFFSAGQVFDIRPLARKWLAGARTPNLAGRFTPSGLILVTCSGDIGNCILTYGPIEGALVSHDLLRVQTNPGVSMGYIYALLRSGIGKGLASSREYGSVVKHLEVEHLAELPVPRPPTRLSAETDLRIRRAFELRTAAHEMAMQAEADFQDAVGGAMEPAVDGPYALSASTAFERRRRLEAAHYAPSVQSIVGRFFQRGERVDNLEEVAELALPNRFARVYAEVGLPFLDSEDVFKINPTVSKFLSATTTVDAQRYLVQSEWILLARSGQIYGLNGSSILANAWHTGKVISEDIIRVIPNTEEINPGYLHTAMNHPGFGRKVMQSLAFGSQIPHLAPEDVRYFPVVRLAGDREDRIAQLVEEASRMRYEARQQEDVAIEAVQEWVMGQLRTKGMAGTVERSA